MKKTICKFCGDQNEINFYLSNKSCCKKCVSKKALNRYYNLSPDDKEEYKNRVAAWQEKKIFQYRFLQAKNRAILNGLSFDLTTEDIKTIYERQNGLCYYSGIEMKMDRTGIYTVSVDRINSSKGYTVNNVVLCTSIVNSMKNKLPVDEFIKIVNAIARHNK